MENVTIRFYNPRKVQAIKVHRTITGTGLKEAKDFIDFNLSGTPFIDVRYENVCNGSVSDLLNTEYLREETVPLDLVYLAQSNTHNNFNGHLVNLILTPSIVKRENTSPELKFTVL